MRTRQNLRRALRLGAILVIVGGCAEHSAVAPAATEQTASVVAGDQLLDPVFGLLTPTQAVTWRQPLAHDVRVSRTIGHEGGTIEIPSLGFRLDVPRGAVSGSTAFSVTAVAGNVVAYDFEPHGAIFAKPLTFTQSLANTDWYLKGYTTAQGGYYPTRSLIDQVLGIVYTLELLDASVIRGSVRFRIDHFSGYMVAGC